MHLVCWKSVLYLSFIIKYHNINYIGEPTVWEQCFLPQVKTVGMMCVCSCASSCAQDECFTLVDGTTSGCVNSPETAWWLVAAWQRGVREENSAPTLLKKKF